MSVSGTVYTVELFPGTSSPHIQSSKNVQHTRSVTTTRPTNINVVPIDYACPPRLRGRLTLLRLTLSRNPWSFGEGVSHSFIVTHVNIRTSDISSSPHGSAFTDLRNAPLPLKQPEGCHNPQLRCMALAPLHFRRKDPYLDQ